jgi:hypothetical protein
MASKEPHSTGDAAEEFLRSLVSTHDNEQMGKGLEELAEMFFHYFKALQNSGFHYSKAFVLTRDWHGMWWTTKLNHEMMHLHPSQDEDEPA